MLSPERLLRLEHEHAADLPEALPGIHGLPGALKRRSHGYTDAVISVEGKPSKPAGVLLRAVIVLLLYSAASALLLGRHALADPRHVCACFGAGDPLSYMWALRWWPYALTHGLNPFYTHVLWSPTGANVAAAALIPFPSVLAWPVTAVFGPLAAYNALTLLSPAVSATTMYFLCERITRRRLPSLAGGWVFGFSSYELGATS